MSVPKLSIIIPCYNEEKTVGIVIERLLSIPFNGWATEIIVVNDGSTDNTASVLKNFSSKIRIVNMPKNSGKGSAVKEGIKSATGDFAIIQDADLECRPEDIPKLLEALNSVSSNMKIAVMGSREMNNKNRRNLFLSRLGSLSITKLINILYSSSLTDALMGYKLFPKNTFSHFSGGGFEGEMVFLAYLLRSGYRIIEVPVFYSPRSKEAGKKISYRHGFKIIIAIVSDYIFNIFSSSTKY